MSIGEKSPFGAQVVGHDPNLPHAPLTTVDSVGSSFGPAVEQHPTSKEDYNPTSQHPFSAFYSHPRTRTSFEQANSESKTHIRIYQHDLETGSRLTQATESYSTPKKDCRVWPNSGQAQKEHLAMQCKKQGCSPFSRLSNKQKFWLKIIIGLVLVGAIVGLSVGISKAVGGSINEKGNRQTPMAGGR